MHKICHRITSILGLCFILTFAIGCESEAQYRERAARERATFDGWYPPGSTRDEIIAKFGEPVSSVERPEENPTKEQWLDAIKPKISCLKPHWIVHMVLAVEARSGQRVQWLETHCPPDHITFAEKLDFLFGAHVEAVYYNAEKRVITSEMIPEHIFTD